MKSTHLALVAAGLSACALGLFLLTKGPTDAEKVDREGASGPIGSDATGGAGRLADIPSGGSTTRSREAAATSSDGDGAADPAAAELRTLTVTIDWPAGAAPSEELEVLALDYPLAAGALGRAVLSDPDAIVRDPWRDAVFGELDDPTDDPAYARLHSLGSATVSEGSAGIWAARIELPRQARRAWIYALGGGFSSERGLEVRREETSVRLAVQAGAQLSLVVTGSDTTGTVVGAKAHLAVDTSGAATMAMGSESSSRFSADVLIGPSGRAEISTVPARTPLELRLRGDGVQTHLRKIAPLEPGERRTVTVELLEGAAVRGQVVGASGATVAGATVTASFPGKTFGFDDEVVRTVEADAAGQFLVPNLGDGAYVLRAARSGLLQSTRTTVEVEFGEDVEGISLVLEEGQSVAGRVELEDGRPAPVVEIVARFDPSHMAGLSGMSAGRGALGSTRSTADGSFRVTGLGFGPFVVEAEGTSADGTAPLRARIDGVRAGATDLTLVVRPPRTLSGQLVNDQGEPIADETVVCARVVAGSIGDVHLDQHEATSDAAGRFAVTDLEVGSWSLSVTSERHISVDEVLVELERSTEDITVIAQRTVTVRGRVVDPLGEACPNARVGDVPSVPAWQAALSRKATPMSTRTREDGTFELSGMPPGRLQLRAVAEDLGPTVSEPFPALAGQLVEGIEMQLSRGGTIEGIVFDDKSRPAAGRVIVIQETNLSTMRTESSAADGTFRAMGLGPGNYQIIAMNPAMEMAGAESGGGMAAMMKSMNVASATVVDGETTFVFLGAPPAHPVEVSGTVKRGGQPFADAVVSWMPSTGGMYEKMKVSSTDENGRYELTLDDTGDYLINVAKITGGTGQQMTVEFSASIPRDRDSFSMDFEVPGGTLAGQVVDENGDPVAGARLTVMGVGAVRTDRIFGGSYAEIVTEDDGTFEVLGLRAGEYQVAAGGASMFAESSDPPARTIVDGIELGENERRDGIRIELPAPGSVEVVVADSGGRPIAGATIFLRDERGRHTEVLSMTSTGLDGVAVVRGLAPGRYTAAARTGELASVESAPVTVASGAQATVTLALQQGTRIIAEVKARKDDLLVAADVMVVDSQGRDVTRRLGIFDIQTTYAQSDFSMFNRRIGPLPPDTYTVSATTSDGRKASRRITLDGEPERVVSLRLR